MSDEIAGAVVTLTEKSAQAALEAAKIVGQAAKAGFNISVKTVEMIAKLLEDLFGKTAEKIRNGSDLTDIKPGQVSITKLFENARSLGDSIQFSEQGVSKEDAGKMATLAKKYAIPIAFEHDKANDCYYPRVRGSDKDVFEQICKDILRDNLNSKSSLMGSKEVAEWEVPYISKVMSSSDLPMQFAKMNDGKVYALYDKADEKAVNMAFANYEKMANEADERFEFSKSDDGYYFVKDNQSGREFSMNVFDLPNSESLQKTLSRNFGLDQTTSALVAGRFAKDMLSPDTRNRFFKNDSQREFTEITANITVKDESILCKDYTCLHLTTKDPAKSYIAFRDGKGQFAVLQPEKMTRKQMSKVITENLGITDQKVLDALVEKADLASRDIIYSKCQNLVFTNCPLNATDKANIMNSFGGDYVDENEVQLKLTSSINVQRTSQDTFTFEPLTSYTVDNYYMSCFEPREISLADRKQSIDQILDFLVDKAVIPKRFAIEMAIDTYDAALRQSAECTLIIRSVSPDEAVISGIYQSGDKDTCHISLADREQAIADVRNSFPDASDEMIEGVVDKAIEFSENEEYFTDDFGSKIIEGTPAHDLSLPEASESEPDVPDLGNLADNDVDEDVEVRSAGRGGR